MTIQPPSLAEIRETARLISPHVLETPVHEWTGREIEAAMGSGTRVLLKLELFQRSGTFKARGAVNSMLCLGPDALARGVTAVSAGNHAIATAFAASRLGTTAKVVMMSTADPARIDRCRRYGAEVIIAQNGAAGFALVDEIARTEGRAFIHPFEGPAVTRGTGTLGLEFLERVGSLDAVIVPIGGGGLCSGVSLAIKSLQPQCEVLGVEPTGADTMHRSFAAGCPQSRSDVATIADSLAPPFALPYGFAICRQFVDELVMVDDDQIRQAMALLFREMKLAVEPAAAAATAAMIGPLRDRLAGRRVGIIICGANIAIDTFHRHVAAGVAQVGLQ